MESLPAEDITLLNVAQRFHYHPAYVSRKFRELTGLSFHKYVESLKIQRGKVTLLTEAHSVSTVCSGIFSILPVSGIRPTMRSNR
ncbi:MAG TPA: helix-turn-helix transcriptional regulator [Fastidiosipila sp.]|nr:helix-turn-helix transcriptional regulator [Fastidiosipila sp.]